MNYNHFDDFFAEILSAENKVYILYWNNKNWLQEERDRVEAILLPQMNKNTCWQLRKQESGDGF